MSPHLALFVATAVAAVGGLESEDESTRRTAETETEPVGRTPETEEPPPLEDPFRHEFTLVPTFGFSTDQGLGLGALGVLAKFHPDYYPFHWRLAWQVSFSAYVDPAGRLVFPHMDHFVHFERPGLAGGRLRLRMELSLSRDDSARYYGMGNASVDERPWETIDPGLYPDEYELALRHNQYIRTYPRLRGDAWIDLEHGFRVFTGLSATANWIGVYDDSRLALDLDGVSGEQVQDLLSGAATHGAVEGYGGLMWDSRDHEYTPNRGMFHDVSVRGGPLLGQAAGYVGLNATARFFVPIVAPYLVVGWRVLGDILIGTPPFYELARHGGLYPEEGPGGGRAVRGVPAMRYHGKRKLIGNLELRSKFVWFRLFRQRSNLGAVLFADAGRVWADTSAAPELDGTGLGLTYGLGGGLRLQIGETFVVRADVGFSPDGWGIYLDTDHVF